MRLGVHYGYRQGRRDVVINGIVAPIRQVATIASSWIECPAGYDQVEAVGSCESGREKLKGGDAGKRIVRGAGVPVLGGAEWGNQRGCTAATTAAAQLNGAKMCGRRRVAHFDFNVGGHDPARNHGPGEGKILERPAGLAPRQAWKLGGRTGVDNAEADRTEVSKPMLEKRALL